MTVEELNKQIKTGMFKPVYFFYGDEQYLLSHKVSAMEKKLVTKGMEDFNRLCFEGKKTDLEAVLEAAEQFPQMSDKKVVIVKNSGFFNQGNTREYKRLKEAVKDLPPYTCLIFIEEHFDKKKEKNVKFLEEYGGVLSFDYLPVIRVEIWLEEKLRKEEKRIIPRDLTYMVRLCGQSLGKIQMEYEKLLNYLGDRTKITREDIDAVVDRTVEYRVYDMLDNITAGRSGKAREQLKYLRDAREQPTMVLGIMIGKLSELFMCKQLKDTGMPAQQMVDYFDFRRPLFAVNKTVEESKRYGEPYLKRMIKKGLAYDLDIKNGRLEGWTAAELYLAELTKRPERP